MIPVAEFLQLAEACAKPVPAATLLAIARTESALYPWALSLNRPRRVAQLAGVDGADFSNFRPDRNAAAGGALPKVHGTTR